MKKRTRMVSVISLLLAIALLISSSPIQVIAVEADSEAIEKVYCTATLEDDFADNELLICVMPEYNTYAYEPQSFSGVDCTDLEELTTNIAEGVLGRILKMTISGHSKQNVLDAIGVLEQREDIYCVEPNYVLHAEATPNDPYYTAGNQWAIDKIDLPQAWNLSTGSSTVYVGVIDSGIDNTHPDLVNQVDTQLSRSFITGSSESTDANPLYDSRNHGTAVAGIIGAQGKNSVGITGACWSVKLVSLKVLGVDTSNDSVYVESFAIKAVDYAKSAGIDILNFSIGMDNNSLTLLRTAIQSYSGLFVCAAGNKSRDNDSIAFYPSQHNDLSNLISVGSSTSADQKAGTSNFGKQSVDLFAPGDSVLSCFPLSQCQSGECGGSEGGHYSNGYHYMGGTSFATPYVTGVAALMLSINPNLSASTLKTKILDNVEIVFDSNSNIVFENYCKTGGRLNAYYAVNSLTHTHSYTCTSRNGEWHEMLCSCGRVVDRERHQFAQSGPTLYCTKCDYEDGARSLD